MYWFLVFLSLVVLLIWLSTLYVLWKIQNLKLQNQKSLEKNQKDLLDKLVTLISVKDPLAYQAVQAMSQDQVSIFSDPHDPSDANEADYIMTRDGIEEVNDLESSAFGALIDPSYGFAGNH